MICVTCARSADATLQSAEVVAETAVSVNSTCFGRLYSLLLPHGLLLVDPIHCVCALSLHLLHLSPLPLQPKQLCSACLKDPLPCMLVHDQHYLNTWAYHRGGLCDSSVPARHS